MEAGDKGWLDTVINHTCKVHDNTVHRNQSGLISVLNIAFSVFMHGK